MSESPPRIVVLDGYTLNPGDLSWERLESLGKCSIYDRSTSSEIVDRAAEAGVILTNKAVLDRKLLEQLPNLKYIGITATGTNVVDLAAAQEHGIVVTNVPSYSTPSVAQLTIAHLLNIALRVGDHARSVREGKWSQSRDWCFWDYPQAELAGLTLGIIGLGQIGAQVARLASAFDMEVLANNRTPKETPSYVEMVDLEMLFRRSDVVSLHCPLTDETRGLVGHRELRLMKSTAWLINTSRGPLIDEVALADALEQGEIAAAALDVRANEPPAPDDRLVAAPNCFITPHLAWATRCSRERLLTAVTENVAAFLAGNPKNQVTA